MPFRGDIRFYARLLDSISATKDLRTLRQAHAIMLTVGIAHHDLLRTKLSAAYARCARVHEAHHILSRANRQPTFLFNSLIRAYASLRLFRPSLAIFRQMLAQGKSLDPRTLAAVLRSCAGLSSLRLGRAAHVTVVVCGFSSNLTVSNSLVSMYSRCGDMACARQVFDRMDVRDVVSWTAMIDACGAHGCSDEAASLFEEMVEAGEQPDAKALTAVLAACSHGGLVEFGRRVFGMMVEGRFGARPGVEHYTCMVDMLGRAGRVEEAEALMKKFEVKPDEGMLGALLGACRVHGKLDVAERVAERLYGKQYV